MKIGTREQSLIMLDATVPVSDRDGFSLPDGQLDALRVIMTPDGSHGQRDKAGTLRYCAPWLLCGIFGNVAKGGAGPGRVGY